jgi:transposase
MWKARVITRARVLLKSARGLTDAEIASEEGVSESRIERIRSRFAFRGFRGSLYDAPRPGQPKKLDEKAEKYLIATTCTDPPVGADHWTLELLAEKMVKDKKVASISSVAIMHYLRRNDLAPSREKNVVHPSSDTRVH